ncbi:hypothetical protein ACFYXM_11225 [Streptomyces sp. NPDC002476]|uniref:hypothetical protein n=1 Tax=Streptomyces sp. NPDC002476 TaxID=3364648 RepID=UPI0036AF8393
MTSTDTVPAETLHQWQRRGQKLIDTLLTDAPRLNLPPLTWTLAVSGAVTGSADHLNYTPAEQREAIRQWAAHVGVPVDTEHTPDGREELYAGWQIAVDGEVGPVQGCFRATVLVIREGA